MRAASGRPAAQALHQGTVVQNNQESRLQYLGHSLVRSLAPLTRSLALHYSPCSRAPLTRTAHLAHSLARGKVIDWTSIFSVFFSILQVGEFTREYLDETDWRPGGCFYSWRLQIVGNPKVSIPGYFRETKICHRWHAQGDAGQCNAGRRDGTNCAKVSEQDRLLSVQDFKF